MDIARVTSKAGRCSVIIDVRCLQDRDYAGRGVGRHVLGMLRLAPRNWHLIGLTDRALPAVSPEARETLDAVATSAYAATTSGASQYPAACFISSSPMTHDPLFAGRLLSDPVLLRAAIVYDFIPRRLPERYMPHPADRVRYAVGLRWLARCDLFTPIWYSAARDLATMLRVPASGIVVTGCALDPAFETIPAAARGLPRRHLLVVGGGDPRKNPEVVIRAHARSSVMQQGAGIPLVIAGSYSEDHARAFHTVAANAGGRPELVEVPGRVPEEALMELHAQALVMICPSYDEGFSLPVIEGMAAGLPCLASDIPAQAELVEDAACRFSPDDDVALRSKLERVLADEAWRAAILARQAEVWPRFRASVVAGRFWDAIGRRMEAGAPRQQRVVPLAAPPVSRGHRARVAMLSPLPPDRSGVADYTAATAAELGRLVDLHVFTEAAQPKPLRNAAIWPLTALPHLKHDFDRVISVIGNSDFHLRIFEMLRRYGAACIAHDARMMGFYVILLGRKRALAVAGKELGRQVSEAELDAWLADEGKLEALFLGEIAESATPTIVHSRITAQMFADRYGVAPAYLPFSIYRPWRAEQLTRECRAAARARLGILPGEVAIVTFGHVHDNKAPEDCVWAIDVLRSWGIPATLHFAGAFHDQSHASGLRPLVAQLGLASAVRFASGYVSEQTYRDYLVGSDLAIQLRTYGLGALSGALLDCAAAGLPTVTNESLAAAVEVPDYIRAIPDAISPVLLAGALADLLAAGLAAERPEQARCVFSEERSFRGYARNLCQHLAIDVTPSARPRTVFPHHVKAVA